MKTPLASSSAAFRKSHRNLAVEAHEELLQSPNAYTTPWISGWDEFGLALGSALDTIWNLRSDSARVPLEDAQREVDAILARAAARRSRRNQRDPWLDLVEGG